MDAETYDGMPDKLAACVHLIEMAMQEFEWAGGTAPESVVFGRRQLDDNGTGEVLNDVIVRVVGK